MEQGVKGVIGGELAGGAWNEFYESMKLGVNAEDFINSQLTSYYKRVFMDVLGYCSFPSKEIEASLFAGYSSDKNNLGIVEAIVKAIVHNSNDGYDVVQNQVYIGIDKVQESATTYGQFFLQSSRQAPMIVYPFMNYTESKILREYYGIMYSLLGAVYRGVNISQALLILIEGLRDNVRGGTKTNAINKIGRQIYEALSGEKGVVIGDAKDKYEFAKVEIANINEAMQIIYSLISNTTGRPISIVSGSHSGGLNTTGEGEEKQDNKALKSYYLSIVKPNIEATFNAGLREGQQAIFLSITFPTTLDANLISQLPNIEANSYLTDKAKWLVINRILGLTPSENDFEELNGNSDSDLDGEA